jgi:hypothetical protein
MALASFAGSSGRLLTPVLLDGNDCIPNSPHLLGLLVRDVDVERQGLAEQLDPMNRVIEIAKELEPSDEVLARLVELEEPS